jgi:hypothetical protein
MKRITGTLREILRTFMIVPHSLVWEIFHTKVVVKIKTHFIYSNVFQKSCRLWDVEKYGRARHSPHMIGICALHAGYVSRFSKKMQVYYTQLSYISFAIHHSPITRMIRHSITLQTERALKQANKRLFTTWRKFPQQPEVIRSSLATRRINS